MQGLGLPQTGHVERRACQGLLLEHPSTLFLIKTSHWAQAVESVLAYEVEAPQ